MTDTLNDLTKALTALDIPAHKKGDAEFLRASCGIAKSFIEAHVSRGEIRLPEKERCIADDQWAIDAFYEGYDKANAEFKANGFTGLKPIIGGIRSLLVATQQRREISDEPPRWCDVKKGLPLIDRVVTGAVRGFKYPIPVSIAYMKDSVAYWRVWPSTEQFMPNLLTADCVTHWRAIGNKPEIEVES